MPYESLSITYKCITCNKPTYVRNMLTTQPTSTARPSSVISLKRPPNPSRVQMTNTITISHLYCAVYKMQGAQLCYTVYV
jgi:hypothetical protein